MKRVLIAALMLIAASMPAWAALGENVSTVDADVQALHGQHQMFTRVGYKMHQITMKDGSVVKEYASPAGTVFGVSWQGHFMPNLQQLLGSYMTNYEQGQRTQVVRRRGATIQGDNFVFTSFGHMHAFSGRAYVPGLVPANLTSEVVQ